MAKSSEEISKYNTSGGKPDANLANDALHLNGIPADEFATEKYVQDYHGAKEELLKKYIDEQDALKLQQAKSYTDIAIANQDFSNFAEIKDVQALDEKLSDELSIGLNVQKNYTDAKVQALANDVNENFDDVGQAITSLNNTTRELFTSVSNGKSNVAAAITDQGVSTASDASFDTMATNIRKIPTGGGEPDPYYVNTGDATATASDIMLGQIAYVKGEKIYGSHIDTGRDTSDATATPYDILVGKTAYAQGQKITGILDMSGEVPTYSSDDGVEKIYGGDSRDYTTGTIMGLNDIDGILYNSRTSEIIAGVKFTSPNLSVKYIYNNSIGMTRTLDLSSILAHAESLLQDYADYSSSYTFETGFIGITRADIHTPYFALYSSYGYNKMKEAVITLVPIKEVHTPQDGATIVTWEIDTENIIYYPVESGSSTKFASSQDYLKYVYEDGSRVALIIIDNYNKRSCFVNVDNDNWTIKNNTKADFTYSYGFTSGGSYVIPTASNRVLIAYCSVYDNGIFAFMFDENGNYVKYFQLHAGNTNTTKQATVTSDLKYLVAFSGNSNTINIYRLNVDLVNYTITKTLVNSYTFDNSNIDSLYFMGSNQLLIATYITWNTYNLSSKTYVYEFTPNNETPLELLQSGDYYVGNYTFGINNVVCDTFLYTTISRANNVPNCMKYLKLIENYEELIALKYNGEYYYPQRGGVLTAGQGDVRAGKTFIGWMGYEETGTMEVE